MSLLVVFLLLSLMMSFDVFFDVLHDVVLNVVLKVVLNLVLEIFLGYCFWCGLWCSPWCCPWWTCCCVGVNQFCSKVRLTTITTQWVWWHVVGWWWVVGWGAKSFTCQIKLQLRLNWVEMMLLLKIWQYNSEMNCRFYKDIEWLTVNEL